VRVGDRLKAFLGEGPTEDKLGWHGPFDIGADGAPITGIAGVPPLVLSDFRQTHN